MKQKLKQIKLEIVTISNKIIRKAKRIALAVVITQFILVIGFYNLAKTDILSHFKNESIVIHNVQAQEIPEEQPKEEEKKPETTKEIIEE